MDKEIWYALQFSPKGEDDWAALGTPTYDTEASARKELALLRKGKKAAYPKDGKWEYRVVRITNIEEVLKD